MLVHAFNHLIPHSDGAPTVLSSPTTSTYIPDIPYDDFTRRQYVQPEPPHGASSRRDRRLRTAPYPLSISVNAASVQSQQPYQKMSSDQHAVPLHSPRPVTYFNPAQAFDNVAASTPVHSPLAFAPGAHGTILGQFSPQSESSSVSGTVFDELTATQMAYMLSSTGSAREVQSNLSPPCASEHVQLHQQSSSSCHSLGQIQMPQVPSIPQVPSAYLPTTRPVDFSTSTMPNGALHLPDAVPPEASQSHLKPNATLAPPNNSFPTPVELLGDLSLRDAETAQKDHRRAERRKVQQVHEAEHLGFNPTDPDTISTHDKKRLYLDCLEQYVIYLHNQLRLAGYDPVPVERVSNGRGLTSRSIRTMIVHLKSTTAKLHAQKRESEIKYDELRAQLGADADLTAPSLAASNPFAKCAPKTSDQAQIQTATTRPTTSTSSRGSKSGNKNPSMSNMRRYSVAGLSVQNAGQTAALAGSTAATIGLQPTHPLP